MAKNKTVGDSQRKGAVKTRSQTPNPITGTWTKRDDKSGKFMDVKADPKPFKGVRKPKKKSRRKSVAILKKAAKRYGKSLKRLAAK